MKIIYKNDISLKFFLYVISQLSSISDIPEEYINIAKGKGTFPCDNSVLRIQNEHDWNEHHDSLSFNFEDGAVFLYRYV